MMAFNFFNVCMYVDKNKCEKKSTSIEYTFIILEYNERMFFFKKIIVEDLPDHQNLKYSIIGF